MYSGGLVRKGDLATGEEACAMLVRRPLTECKELVEDLRWRVGVADRCGSVGVEDRDRDSSLAREGLREGIRGLGAGDALLTAGLNGDKALGVRGELATGEPVERESCRSECDKSFSASGGVFNVDWRRDGALL